MKRFGAKEGWGLIYVLRTPSNSCAEVDGGGEQEGRPTRRLLIQEAGGREEGGG